MEKKVIRIPVCESFSFKECLWFLNRNFDDCIHEVSSGNVRKALPVNGEVLLLEITQSEACLEVRVLKGDVSIKSKAYIRRYIAEWFDMERDIQPFYQLLSRHQSLSYMPDRYKGLRLTGIPDLFEALAWGIIGQQINLAFAYKIKRRLVEKYGRVIAYEGRPYHLFPSCEIIAAANPAELREIQFSARKAEYLTGLARVFVNRNISKQKLAQLPDFESRQKMLTGIRGIGIWTANYALMKCLKDSCIPYGDAGLLNALIRHKIIKQKDDSEGIEKLFRKFKGWESYLSFYLWRSLAPTDAEKDELPSAVVSLKQPEK